MISLCNVTHVHVLGAGADQLGLDNQLVCSSLENIICPSLGIQLLLVKTNKNQRHVLHLNAQLRPSHQLMSQTEVFRVAKEESKVLTKLLEVRMVINRTQLHQKNSTTWEKRLIILKLSFFKGCHFFEYLPLLGGISQNSLVVLDPSLSTAHSEPQTNIAEFCGSNPAPVTVMVWPPPKLPESNKTEWVCRKLSLCTYLL